MLRSGVTANPMSGVSDQGDAGLSPPPGLGYGFRPCEGPGEGETLLQLPYLSVTK
jgi:hypothetical protein